MKNDRHAKNQTRMCAILRDTATQYAFASTQYVECIAQHAEILWVGSHHGENMRENGNPTKATRMVATASGLIHHGWLRGRPFPNAYYVSNVTHGGARTNSPENLPIFR
jgi:hypothetical protein